MDPAMSVLLKFYYFMRLLEEYLEIKMCQIVVIKEKKLTTYLKMGYEKKSLYEETSEKKKCEIIKRLSSPITKGTLYFSFT